MNYSISVIFRAIPLVMALFCFSYGALIYTWGNDPDRVVAGPVVMSLGMICIALFCTAATIIRQIIGTYSRFFVYALPILGYSSAALTIGTGMWLIHRATSGPEFVAGHVVAGVGFIAVCIATAATASTRFTFIPGNAHTKREEIPEGAFLQRHERALVALPAFSALILWVWAGILLTSASTHHAPEFIAGHVMAGLAAICTSLIALVASIARQIRNVFTEFERGLWPTLVLVMGTLILLWGVWVVVYFDDMKVHVIGFIMVGLALVCFSISSKVILLSKIWWHEFELANRIPMIPIFTALGCAFLAAFLFEFATTDPQYFIPARVLMGLGAICITLFSIVSILESGTSSSE
ncbi:DUF2776 family protein [Actinomyces vulturis]|uniref:DUF2776 family protein n=1 Tax=Actinomyces vulturis TaxID=1857645 RepID=UPI000835C4F3|nr:DUF2776 family protein [Actinomyces vulturis]